MPPKSTTPGRSNSRLLAAEDTLKSPIKSPLANSFYLNKTLQGNGSRVSVNEMQPPHTPTGIRAQLGHLLPRHAYFRARIQIHQISSVPFVSGEFGVRWKFKGVQSNVGPKQGLLGRVKARAEQRKTSHDDKGKGREGDNEGYAPKRLQDLISPTLDSEDGHVSHQADTSFGTSSDRTIPSLTSSVSSRASEHGHSQNLSVGWSTSTSTTADSTISSVISSSNASHVTILPSPLPGSPTDPIDILSPTFPPTTAASTTLARGMTPFKKLKEHSVIWNQTLDNVLKFDIDRENSQVLPNPLKLVVMQRVIPDDPNGPPQNPRLGAVYLNLAEYIDKGPVERRYLLKESKTNATLKLTIEMEYVNGETSYVAPPLAKMEIMTGLANFLDNDGIKKRPRALDLYGPYRDQEELEIDLLGVSKSARPKTAKSAKSSRRPSEATNPTESETEEEGGYVIDADVEEEVEVAFDVQRLPIAYGTKTTETLIEAIFNPVKISDPRKESPFTVYEPPSDVEEPFSGKTIKGMPPNIGLGLSGVALDRKPIVNNRRQDSLTSEEFVSVYDTTSSSAASVRTTSSSSKSRAASKDSNGPFPGGGSVSDSHHNGVTAKSTPEGRVVVTAVEQPALSGIRGWWKRHTQTPGTATPTPTPRV